MSYKKIMKQTITNYEVQEFIVSNIPKTGYSSCKLMMTLLGEKIVIYASRPGLIVGRGGAQIKKLTKQLKDKFNFENPQIEIQEVENPMFDANIVANRIAQNMERYGLSRFKVIGHKTIEDIMNAGGRGVEILISGKVPSSRARNWRFYKGYMKKCGDIALTGVNTAYATALLKSGVVGIKVKIMPPDIDLPDEIKVFDEKEEKIETEVTDIVEEKKERKSEEKKKPARKKTAKKEKKTAKAKPKSKKTSKKKDDKK